MEWKMNMEEGILIESVIEVSLKNELLVRFASSSCENDWICSGSMSTILVNRLVNLYLDIGVRNFLVCIILSKESGEMVDWLAGSLCNGIISRTILSM